MILKTTGVKKLSLVFVLGGEREVQVVCAIVIFLSDSSNLFCPWLCLPLLQTFCVLSRLWRWSTYCFILAWLFYSAKQRSLQEIFVHFLLHVCK